MKNLIAKKQTMDTDSQDKQEDEEEEQDQEDDDEEASGDEEDDNDNDGDTVEQEEQNPNAVHLPGITALAMIQGQTVIRSHPRHHHRVWLRLATDGS